MMPQWKLLLFAIALTLAACSKQSGFAVAEINLPSTEDGQGGGGDPEIPTTTTQPPLSQTWGTFDSNCQNNSTYDACIFWKSPLAKQNTILPHLLTFGDDLSTRQTFGVKLQDQKDPLKLESASLRVYTSELLMPIGYFQPATNTKEWKIPYALETDKHWTAQTMSYFWLTSMEKHLFSRTGIYYAKGKSIGINAYNSKLQNNAFWNGREIVVGTASQNGADANHELALSAEVTLHEMGHANLSFSGGGGSSGTCADKRGCMGAINEGQADFHYVMLFPENTSLAATAVNNLAGWSVATISRDVRQLSNTTAQEIYTATQGEIHGMGSAYASILWEIYSDSRVVKAEFEKIFMLHLQKLTSSSNFVTAKDIFLAEDQTHLGGKYHDIIEAAFTKKGL